MSIFLCAGCDNIRDADDGCDELAPGSIELICINCMDEREAAADQADTPTPAGSASMREENDGRMSQSCGDTGPNSPCCQQAQSESE